MKLVYIVEINEILDRFKNQLGLLTFVRVKTPFWYITIALLR